MLAMARPRGGPWASGTGGSQRKVPRAAWQGNAQPTLPGLKQLPGLVRLLQRRGPGVRGINPPVANGPPGGIFAAHCTRAGRAQETGPVVARPRPAPTQQPGGPGDGDRRASRTPDDAPPVPPLGWRNGPGGPRGPTARPRGPPAGPRNRFGPRPVRRGFFGGFLAAETRAQGPRSPPPQAGPGRAPGPPEFAVGSFSTRLPRPPPSVRWRKTPGGRCSHNSNQAPGPTRSPGRPRARNGPANQGTPAPSEQAPGGPHDRNPGKNPGQRPVRSHGAGPCPRPTAWAPPCRVTQPGFVPPGLAPPGRAVGPWPPAAESQLKPTCPAGGGPAPSGPRRLGPSPTICERNAGEGPWAEARPTGQGFSRFSGHRTPGK